MRLFQTSRDFMRLQRLHETSKTSWNFMRLQGITLDFMGLHWTSWDSNNKRNNIDFKVPGLQETSEDFIGFMKLQKTS
jgi:hypothetical protein